MSTLALGKLRIDVLPEIAHRMMPVSFLFNDLEREDMRRNADWLGPEYLDPEGWLLGLAFQAYVIRADGLNILIDACNGERKQRPTATWQHDLKATAFLDNLAALGLRSEDIDVVACTHLHCDHVDWNTTLRGGKWWPTFTNARYVINRAEFDHYEAMLQKMGPAAVNHGAFADSVLPVVEAGLAQFVDADHQLLSGLDGAISLSPSPGHSPGHVCIHARASGDEAVICGDVLHHPIQCDMPAMIMRADYAPLDAIATRKTLLADCADTGKWLLAGHAPHMGIAQVRRHGDVFRMFAAD